MRYFKIAQKVHTCTYKNGTLTDKNKVYPETQWEPGEALRRVARGFLVEVTESGEPVDAAAAPASTEDGTNALDAFKKAADDETETEEKKDEESANAKTDDESGAAGDEEEGKGDEDTGADGKTGKGHKKGKR